MTIGIFWIYNAAVIGKSCSINEGETIENGITDSPYKHYELWENSPGFLRDYPMLYGTEYQGFPRGRVLYSANDDKYMIYMDPTLFTPEIKAAIRDFFALTSVNIKWLTDPHYTTNSDTIQSYFEN